MRGHTRSRHWRFRLSLAQCQGVRYTIFALCFVPLCCGEVKMKFSPLFRLFLRVFVLHLFQTSTTNK